MKYFVFMLGLIACGKQPLGSCRFETAYYCMDFHEKDDKETLNKKSAKFICEELYEAKYHDEQCDRAGSAAVCDLPPTDDVKMTLVLYKPSWDNNTSKLLCDNSKGILE